MIALVKELFIGPIWIGLIGGWIGLAIITQFTRDLTLEVEMETGAAGHAKVYFREDGGFVETRAVQEFVAAGEQKILRFSLPTSKTGKIRFDPLDQDTTILLNSIRWDEPWPGRDGKLDLKDADWRGSSVRAVDDGSLLIVPDTAEIPDPYGIWSEEIGWHSSSWRAYRIISAILFAVIVTAGSLIWNRRVLQQRLVKGK